MEQLTFEYTQALVMGIPAAAVFVRHLSQIVTMLNRSVSAMERIADRLDKAQYVSFDEPNIREVYK